MRSLISMRERLSGEITSVFSGNCAYLLRDSGDALVAALNLMDSALSVKIPYCFLYFALDKLLDYLFQFWAFWRTISSSFTVFIPASWSCAKGLPASTASCCRRSPTSNTRSFGWSRFTNSCTCLVDAREDSSST